MSRKILILDDDINVGQLITLTLQKKNYLTYHVTTCSEAADYLASNQPQLILLDVNLPDGNGKDFLKTVQSLSPRSPVIMISAHGSIRLAVECLRAGAYDFVEKPFEIEELETRVAHVFEKADLEEKVASLELQLGEKYKLKSMIGKSPLMHKVFQKIELATRSEIPVLITGESGTGKELVARAIHFNGQRSSRPFVALNCSAIPAHLLESELFGYEKGAFTGAASQRIGKFESAQQGTIFLDEIAELPQELQSKLLRVLQEREFERLGSNETIKVEARFIFATNQSLKNLIQEKKFREDLFFRINGLPVDLPPLRERQEDILPLVHYFVSKQSPSAPKLEIEKAAADLLQSYSWPGNVRELENFVGRTLLIKGDGRKLRKEDVDLLESADTPHKSLSFEEMEKQLLTEALEKTGGQVAKVANILKVSRDTVYRKLKKYSIHIPPSKV